MGICLLALLAESSIFHEHNYTFQLLVNDTSAEIDNCVFVSISCAECFNGGAILIDSEVQRCSISSSFFEKCSAIMNGGAIMIINAASTIKYCCFYRCRCSIEAYGHGTAICCQSNRQFTILWLLSALECPKFPIISDNGVFKSSGSTNASSLNSSFCSLKFSGSVLFFNPDPSSVISSEYIGSYSHPESAGIGVCNFKKNDVIQLTNIFNVSSWMGCIFLWSGNEITLRSFVFIGCCNSILARSFTGYNAIEFYECYTDAEMVWDKSVTGSTKGLNVVGKPLQQIPISNLRFHVCSGDVTAPVAEISAQIDYCLKLMAFPLILD